MPLAPAILQPQQGARLGGSPICQGLIFATIGAPGTGFIDFVSGRLPTITGATSGIDSAGLYAKPAASSGQIRWPAGSTGLDKVTGPGTLLVCMRGNNNTANWRAFGSREDSSTGDGVYLLYDDQNNASNGFNCGANNNNYRADSFSGALGTNSEQSFHTFGFSWDGAAVQLWADGKLNRTVSGGNAAFSPNSNNGRFTRIQSGGTASDFLFAYAWNRVLSPAEIASITSNPWQIFVARRAAVAAPASGTTVAAGAGHLLLTGKQPTVSQTANQSVAAAAGHVTLSGKQPSVSQGASQAVAPSAGHLTLTGKLPTVTQSANQSVAASTGHITLTGRTPSVSQPITQYVAPAKGALTLTGKQPGVSQVVVTFVAASGAHLVLSGHVPTVVRTANQSIAAGAGGLRLTGRIPTVVRTLHGLLTVSVRGVSGSVNRSPGNQITGAERNSSGQTRFGRNRSM